MLPSPPRVDYGVFMQGLVQAMQTQAHTQAALQAQLEAQERADIWWSSLLRTQFEDGAVEVGWDEFVGGFRPSYPRAGTQRDVSSGRRDGAVLGGEEGFSEEACSSFPEAGEEEGGFSVTAAFRGIGKQSASIGSRIAPEYSRKVSVERHQPQQQQQQRQRQDDQGDLEPQLECLR
ncbi:hypothetical protein Taro_020215 [Colocasia esculenta]|uniref:Uncharacterized protein n=1 Tax=Colocasia esculenta TaxID=4460 RepID=A0A843UVV5_COLES|nr:hypothetical protein [Colocasia esculenta]